MIRLATAADLPDLAVLERELFGADAWDEAALRAELDGPGRRFVVTDPDGTDGLVGYAVSMSLGDVVDLQRIAVRADAQRSGVATALLDDLLEHPREADRMLLEVSAANGAAIAFYARAGFARIDVRARYYRDGSDAIVMRRALVTDGHWSPTGAADGGGSSHE
ncbi:GNAT family N-acetyltransferase [Nocardioides sp.]|uniref:GNAT family N-acetyltransferase n=1 Tax=Nocardioides sp. TaxID=35761 RepID=UPI002CD9087F|nr:GNAT family N-acetyltransferase [Nocardioides sp.]HXH76964.1 GNAT family N-acetyltransferase [Nocardioides sp.]